MRTRVGLAGLLVIGAVGCTGEGAPTSTPEPTKAPPVEVAQAPGPRDGHDLEFLPTIERVVLLHGVGETTEPWTWDGTEWQPLAIEGGPQTRFLGGSAFWPERSALVSYGGLTEDGSAVPETWKFNGDVWVEHEGIENPTVSDHFSLEYDAASGSVVLFGGRKTDTKVSDETWMWDGVSWERVSTGGPPGRIHGAMAYDGASERVVMFGGDASLNNARVLSDTWAWSGGVWREISTPSARPSARADAALEFHPDGGGVVLFGGATEDERYPRDTWVLIGDEWERIETAVAPPGRVAHDMAYEPLRDVIVLYGGFAGDRTFTDVWEFDGHEWKEVTPPGTA